jgi:hypothetical protein
MADSMFPTYSQANLLNSLPRHHELEDHSVKHPYRHIANLLTCYTLNQQELSFVAQEIQNIRDRDNKKRETHPTVAQGDGRAH